MIRITVTATKTVEIDVDPATMSLDELSKIALKRAAEVSEDWSDYEWEWLNGDNPIKVSE
ncbi:MAG: hypothetical protein ACRC62_15810 [Microcoleus sp.]